MVDIYLAGVGGQGIITASRIIGEAALAAGKNVLLSETHGMAQRGGSVECTARIGDVYSPLIPDGGADIVVSFELLETLRAVQKGSKKTVFISSTEKVIPLSVSSQKLKYPTLEEISAVVSKGAKKFFPVDAMRLAADAGVPMSSNIVMVGALAGTRLAGLEKSHFETAIGSTIPRRVAENIDAFSRGYEAIAGTKAD